MNVESNMLRVEHLSQIPFNDLLSLYQQGYRLGQNSDIGIELGLNVYNKRGDSINNRNNVRSLASCPSTVTTGTLLTLSATASSGTAPYTYHWSVKKPDGSTDTSLTGSSNSYTFAQDGSYTVSVYVTDSCAAGAKTSSTDSCPIVASTTVPPPPVNNYGCVGSQCLPGYGNLPPGCNNTCVEGATKYNCMNNVCQGPYLVGDFNSLSECQASGCGGGVGEITCNTDQYLVFGKCYSKNTVYITGGIGLVVLLVLMK